ncbi:unnamed protein product [Cochlearia groenlandica]
MSKRPAEETPPLFDSGRIGPDFLGYYTAQVEELLSQEEKIPPRELEATKKSSSEAIGAKMSDLKNEKLNILLRQCVSDIVPEIDDMQSRACVMHLMSQLRNKKPSLSSSSEDFGFKEVEEEDIQLLMRSDPSTVKEIVRKHLNDLIANLNNKQQQLEKLLDSVANTCRSMSRGEKRDLQKSIKELPSENLKRVAKIIKDHKVALGKEEESDEFLVNLEKEDNVMLWRLHFYVGAVKKAKKLAS